MVLGVEGEGSKYWVLAGRTIQPQSDTVRIVTGFLLIAMPILLAAVGLSVHFLVGVHCARWTRSVHKSAT